MISFITCQSSMLRLPGSCCSTVTLTSFGISRAQVAKKMAGFGVRREKAALSSGCKSHPATAPAGSNRSSYGGNEVAEAFGKRVTKYGDSASV